MGETNFDKMIETLIFIEFPMNVIPFFKVFRKLIPISSNECLWECSIKWWCGVKEDSKALSFQWSNGFTLQKKLKVHHGKGTSLMRRELWAACPALARFVDFTLTLERELKLKWREQGGSSSLVEINCNWRIAVENVHPTFQNSLRVHAIRILSVFEERSLNH